MTRLAELRALLARSRAFPKEPCHGCGDEPHSHWGDCPDIVLAMDRGRATIELRVEAMKALPALLDVAEAADEHAWHNCQCTAGFKCSRCVLREALTKLSATVPNVTGDEK